MSGNWLNEYIIGFLLFVGGALQDLLDNIQFDSMVEVLFPWDSCWYKNAGSQGCILFHDFVVEDLFLYKGSLTVYTAVFGSWALYMT